MPTEINTITTNLYSGVVKELNTMNEKNVKFELQTVLKKIIAKTRCMIIYGSHSINFNKEVSSASDIDFMLIFKNNVNSNKISLELEKELAKRNIPTIIAGFLRIIFCL